MQRRSTAEAQNFQRQRFDEEQQQQHTFDQMNVEEGKRENGEKNEKREKLQQTSTIINNYTAIMAGKFMMSHRNINV